MLLRLALVGVAALALGVGAWEPKVAKLEIKPAPQGHTAASRWALRGSAARAECAAQPGPWRVRPRRQGSELRHYEDGHFEHAAGAVPPGAGEVVEVEPPRALAVGLAPLAFQQFEGALGLRLGRLHAIVGVPPNEHRLRSRT